MFNFSSSEPTYEIGKLPHDSIIQVPLSFLHRLKSHRLFFFSFFFFLKNSAAILELSFLFQSRASFNRGRDFWDVPGKKHSLGIEMGNNTWYSRKTWLQWQLKIFHNWYWRKQASYNHPVDFILKREAFTLLVASFLKMILHQV